MRASRYALDVAERELLTVLRTPALQLLAAGFVLLVVGVPWLAETGSYLGLVLDLLVPVEVLVPVLAFAFGYRSLLGDEQSGELETLRTYPISSSGYVASVYLGRAVAVLGVVLLGFGAAGSLVALAGDPQLSVVASHAAADSPALYLRYVLSTALFALAALAIAVLVSAVARSSRGGLGLATVAVLALTGGIDAALIGSVRRVATATDGVPAALLALSPSSAYRRLVFESSVAPVGLAVPGGSTARLSAVALVVWLTVALAVASLLTWR